MAVPPHTCQRLQKNTRPTIPIILPMLATYPTMLASPHLLPCGGLLAHCMLSSGSVVAAPAAAVADALPEGYPCGGLCTLHDLLLSGLGAGRGAGHVAQDDELEAPPAAKPAAYVQERRPSHTAGTCWMNYSDDLVEYVLWTSAAVHTATRHHTALVQQLTRRVACCAAPRPQG